jgi:hypothetical protein
MFSPIQFLTPKTRAWDANTNLQAVDAKRQADIYGFALLSHRDKFTIDPLNLGQWRFYVLPSAVLDARKRSQHSITLRSLESLSGDPVEYGKLRALIAQVAGKL